MKSLINLVTPEVRENPYPVYARMRRESPVCEIAPGGVFAVSRHADILHVVRHPETFSSQGFRAMLQPNWLGNNPVSTSVLVTDPPEHGKLRTLVNKAFGPNLLARYEPSVRRIASSLLDSLPARELDFVSHISQPFPILIICDLLGLEPSLEHKFVDWCNALVCITPEKPAEDQVQRIRGSIEEMRTYFQHVIDEKRRAPTADLTSELCNAEVNGERLTDEQIMSFLFLLLPAGFETTTNLISNAVLLLAARPDLMDNLRAHPASISPFIEEVLRYDPPVQTFIRQTTKETTLAGIRIPQGYFVAALVGSANRDDEVFSNPNTFDINRKTAPSLTFGHGIHFCVGATLARLEARVMLEELCARFAQLERTTPQLPYQLSLTVRGPTSLPLKLHPHA